MKRGEIKLGMLVRECASKTHQPLGIVVKIEARLAHADWETAYFALVHFSNGRKRYCCVEWLEKVIK